jgi:prepilin-type processing-associated H-X9-DG protein
MTPETRKASRQLSTTTGTMFPSDGRFDPSFVNLDWNPQDPLYATGWNYGAEKAVPNATHVFGPARYGDGANYLMAGGHVK